jgi:phosphoserine phosphatase
VPLCVDLDGTLIHSDLLWESFVRVLHTRSWRLLLVPWWFVHGRARLKRELAAGTTLDVAALPYNETLLAFLRAEKARGRRLLLVTASDEDFARPVADHVGLFAETLGSDGVNNLRAARKAAKLVERFGEKGYDYAGNSPPDLPVWARGRAAVVVNAPPALAARARAAGPVAAEFPGPAGTGAAAWRELLRPHLWSKNLLVLAPLVFVSAEARADGTTPALVTLAAICLAAAAAAILADLFGLEADRRDTTRRTRPLAAGRVLLSHALIAGAGLLAGSVALGSLVSGEVAGVLMLFFAAAAAHAWGLKAAPLYAVPTLALAHTTRLVAGWVALGTAVPAAALVAAFVLFVALARVRYFDEP